MLWGVGWALCVATATSSASGSAGSVKAAQAGEASPVLVPWFSPATTRPLEMTLNHDLTYDPQSKQLEINESRWGLRRMVLSTCGGRVGVWGQGEIVPGQVEDIACTVTLRGVQAQQFMKMLELPREGEIRGELNGWVALDVSRGQWRRVELHLSAREGTAFVSRRLIREILASQLGGGVEPATVDQVIDRVFPGRGMIPFENVRLDGRLGQQKLKVTIPLRNEVLDIKFEPQIDSALLWEAWGLIRDKGGAWWERVKSVQWSSQAGR